MEPSQMIQIEAVSLTVDTQHRIPAWLEAYSLQNSENSSVGREMTSKMKINLCIV